MMLQKKDRFSSLLQTNLSCLIARDLEFTDALVTVLDVEISKDNLRAAVKIGVIPPEKELECYYELEQHRKELEHKLLKGARVRHIPKLQFEIEKEK